MPEIRETILSYDAMLSERMKKYMHYHSMRNFVLHFDEIKSERAQERIRALLEEYIEEARANDYGFEGRGVSLQLARKYLHSLSGYYREYSNFMTIVRLKFVLAAGILGDALLYLTGLSSAIWHLPIITICFLLYYLFILIFKAPKGRVYGIFY